MNPWIALLVFLCSVLDDVLYIFFVQCIVRRRVVHASLLSGSLTGMVSFEVIMYSGMHQYAIPNILGSIIGTPLAMWVESKWFSRTVECPMRSNCPKCGRICSDIVAELNERGLGKVHGLCKKDGKVELSGWSYDDFVTKRLVIPKKYE